MNQDEDEIIIERDSPGYSSFQCLSDIGTFSQKLLRFSLSIHILIGIMLGPLKGGTAGLVLGLSIASILKSIESFYYLNKGFGTI